MVSLPAGALLPEGADEEPEAQSPILLGRSQCSRSRKKVFLVQEKEASTRAVTHTPASSVPSGLTPVPDLRSICSVRTVDAELEEKYTVFRTIGTGSFGSVAEAANLLSGQHYAVKSVPKEGICSEIEVHKRLKHPHIVRLYATLSGDTCYHLVLELCAGGTLKEVIQRQREFVGRKWMFHHLPVDRTAKYIWQMLSGLMYLHHHCIAHRDIKAENYLLAQLVPDSPLKLADFGFACTFRKGQKMFEVLGTLDFVAPEVLDASYTESCDVWSAGAVTYLLCTGDTVFGKGSCEELIFRIRKDSVAFKDEQWSHHPPELKDLVAQMLQRVPSLRPSAKRVLARNRWLRRFAKPEKQPQSCCTIS